MKQYNIATAKAHFSKLVKMAMLGEEIVIAKANNKPLLKLLPIGKKPKERRPGSAKGEILSIASDFNEIPGDFREYS